MKLLRLTALTLISLGLSLVLVNTAHAASFTVTDTGDDSAVDPNVSCDTAGNVCTLRSAIEAANAQVGADIINFNITGTGVHTITLGSVLPTITDQVMIDGSTQSGANCGTLVPVTMPNTNSTHTLLIEVNGGGMIMNIINLGDGSDNTVVKGLVLNNVVGNGVSANANGIGSFTINCNYIGTNSGGTATGNITQTGIEDEQGDNSYTIQNNLISGNSTGIFLANNNTINISNNLIGTNAAGTSAIANTSHGVILNNSSGNTVDHNIISGNGNVGIGLNTTTNSVATGNVIGLGIDANVLSNGSDGLVFYDSSNFTIGGTVTNERNVISANGGNGIHIYKNCSGQTPASTQSTTFNNYIGTQMDGTVKTAFGNGAAGIEVNEYYGGCVSVYNHKIGGDEPGQANIIAGNANQGILIHQSSNYDVFSITTIGNSIFSNGQFGIDLAADSDGNYGVADTDLGPNVINDFLMSYPATNANYYINHAVINSTSYTGNQLTVNYNFQANEVEASGDGVSLLPTDLVGYRLDFYLNDNAQDGAYEGYNQGKTHLGSFIVNGSETNATHTFTSPVTLTANQSVSSTVTALWKVIPYPCPTPGRYGDGPPYSSVTDCQAN